MLIKALKRETKQKNTWTFFFLSCVPFTHWDCFFLWAKLAMCTPYCFLFFADIYFFILGNSLQKTIFVFQEFLENKYCFFFLKKLTKKIIVVLGRFWPNQKICCFEAIFEALSKKMSFWGDFRVSRTTKIPSLH